VRYNANPNGYRANGNGNANGTYQKHHHNQHHQHQNNHRQYNSRPRYNSNGNGNVNGRRHHQYQHATMAWYSPEVRLQAVSSVAVQLDYYFNISNLLKDMFLRKHMNSQGWIDLEFVSGFYRVRGLSCGDLSVVRDALDYTQFFEWGYIEEAQAQAQVEEDQAQEQPTADAESTEESTATSAVVPTASPIKNIKIRALTDPLNWILAATERVGCGLDERVPAEIQPKPVFEVAQEIAVPVTGPSALEANVVEVQAEAINAETAPAPATATEN
jgi:hypothetical protein